MPPSNKKDIMNTNSQLSFPRLHNQIERALQKLEVASASIAGCAAVIMMILVALNALMRYFFASPISFQFHLTQYYLLVITTVMALPWGYRKGGAIQIRLLLDKLPASVVDPVMRLGLAVSAAYMLILAWKGYIKFQDALVDNEVVMGVIDWPVAWSWVWVPIGCGLLAVRLAVDATAPKLRHIGKDYE